MKLLILKVADRRDPQLVLSIWEAIFAEGSLYFFNFGSPRFTINSLAGTPQAVQERVSTIAMRFFPSDIAFPLGKF